VEKKQRDRREEVLTKDRWGAFWMSEGVMFLLNATGALPAGDIHAHLPELASWFVVLAAFTWVGVSLASDSPSPWSADTDLCRITGNRSMRP
jgi:hypothetical protein